MDDVAPVQLTHRGGQLQGDRQEVTDRQRPGGEHRLEENGADVLEDQRRLLRLESTGHGDAFQLQGRHQLVLAAK